MPKQVRMLLFPLAFLGVLDAGFLTYEHFQQAVSICSTNPIFGDCGKVLQSEYSVIFGVPLALIGLFHYSLLTGLVVAEMATKKQIVRSLIFVLTTVGFISSLYFVYLQLVVIGAICAFCMVSATTSAVLFLLSQYVFNRDRKKIIIFVFGLFYRNIIKRILFLLDPEFIHRRMTRNGQLLGSFNPAKQIIAYAFAYRSPVLKQTIEDITFESPVGLAAGFDYEARLTQIVPSLGFGFATVGTITNHPYEGNPRPILGRLPQSKSLMVNKGFKNLGAPKTIASLNGKTFTIPIGVSVGRTNTRETTTVKESVDDIVQTFQKFETSKLNHSYYELNISCPNLYGTVSFYSPTNLNFLLREVDNLKIKRPIFIKMPIEKTDVETLRMLHGISQHAIEGVIFGNLQKDRSHSSFKKHEIRQWKTGNFSGKPTFDRSNELIKLSYKHYKNRFVIIGTGGIFSAEDAYKKITLGASLVQLITGMIFNGPQLIGDINIGIEELLKRDGFNHISQAIGVNNIYSKAY